MSDFFLHNRNLEQLKFIPLEVVPPNQLYTVVLSFVYALFILVKKLFPASVWMAI